MTARTLTIPTRFADLAISDSGGDGYPLLLLHGSGSSREAFSRQFESAGLKGLRLLAPDLPGHGQSSNASDSDAYTLPNLADSICEVLDRLELRHVAVFGWSLGGHIAIELLARTKAVRGLMLTGTPPVSKGPLGMLRGFRPSWDMLLGSKPRFSLNDARRFLSLCYGETGTEAHLQSILRADGRFRTVLFTSMMRGDGGDQRHLVEAADMPIAIINGVDEPVARQSYLDSLSIPHLWQDQCLQIPGAGHAPFWQTPEQFNGLLLQFLGDVAAFQVASETRSARRA